MNGHECYIIGAGDFFGLREIPDDSDYVIAADAGYEYCRKNNIIPDLVLGDFDSLGVAPKHPNVMQLPVEKDDTDTVFAIKTGLEKGYRHFYIYGGLGGKRSDHTIANLQSLLYLANRKARGWLFGENGGSSGQGGLADEVLRGDQLDVSALTVILCFDGVARGVTLKGLKYELQNAEVTSDFPIGVSNSMAADEATVEVTDGALLVMYGIGIGEEN